MDKHEIYLYLKKAKTDIVERGLCDEDGDILDAGHRYLRTILQERDDWSELWDYNSIWIPRPSQDYTSVEDMCYRSDWRYVYNTDLTERSLRIFCMAYGVNYDELTDNKPVILDDDEDFVV